MSLADAFVGVLFKKDAEGRTLFFPNGVLGRGFVVPDEETEQRLRRTMLRTQLIAIGGAIAVMLVVQAFVGTMANWSSEVWAGFVIGLVGITMLMRLVVSGIAKGLEPAPGGTRLGLGEVYARQAVALPRWYHWMQVLVSGLLAGACVTLTFMDSEQRLVGVGGFLLFGAITAYSVYGLSAQSAQQ